MQLSAILLHPQDKNLVHDKKLACFFKSAIFILSLAQIIDSSTAYALEAAEPFSLSSEDPEYGKAVRCLTAATYSEADSAPKAGRPAWAQIVLTRVRHPPYPTSVCDVSFSGCTLS